MSFLQEGRTCHIIQANVAPEKVSFLILLLNVNKAGIYCTLAFRLITARMETLFEHLCTHNFLSCGEQIHQIIVFPLRVHRYIDIYRLPQSIVMKISQHPANITPKHKTVNKVTKLVFFFPELRFISLNR